MIFSSAHQIALSGSKGGAHLTCILPWVLQVFFVLMGTFMVLFMQIGVAMLKVGAAQTKNIKTILVSSVQLIDRGQGPYKGGSTSLPGMGL